MKALALRQEEILEVLQAAQTEKKTMSEATAAFSGPLLQGLGISYASVFHAKKDVKDLAFDWSNGEDKCTPAALVRLKVLLDLDETIEVGLCVFVSGSF